MSPKAGSSAAARPPFYQMIPYDSSDDDDESWAKEPVQRDQNHWNNWRRDDKTKTAKCDLCGERVVKWSWRCSHCTLALCSDCVEEDPNSRGNGEAMYHMYHYLARDMLKTLCGCRYNSGQAPYIHEKLKKHGWISKPPRRDEVLARGVEIKRKTKERKERERQARMLATENSKDVGAEAEKPLDSPADDMDTSPSGAQAGPTIAASKPIKRMKNVPNYREASSPPNPGTRPSALMPFPTKPTRAGVLGLVDPFTDEQVGSHLAGGSTVIIGAGIAGLCIAKELAARLKEAGITHTITVVELRSNYCQLASNHCAGLISDHGGPDGINELSELSLGCWQEMAASPDFQSSTDFRQNAVFTVTEGGGKNRKAKPRWYAGQDTEGFKNDLRTIGKLDTEKFARWLYQECVSNGVRFIFDHAIQSIRTTATGELSSIRIFGMTGAQENKFSKLDCERLILAAGPWTPELLQNLFSNSALPLDNNVKKASWWRLPLSEMTEKDDIGLILPNIADANKHLDGKITMTASAARGLVTVTGLDKTSHPQQPIPGDALDHEKNEKALVHLKRLISKRTPGGKNDFDFAEGASSGSNFVSTSRNDLPVIGHVPKAALGKGKGKAAERDSQESGVCLCFGFGMYGTTLAPGAARALVCGMFGEASGIDELRFGVPKD